MELVDPQSVVIGVDFGQKSDPTAIVVAQIERQTTDRIETRFIGRMIERLPLGTPYPVVAKRVAAIVAGLHDRRPRTGLRHDRYDLSTGPTVIADATGLGTPVLDILREEIEARRLACHITGATFTHGQRLTGHVGDREITVGKGYLVSRLQSLLQTDRIDLPRTSEAIALKEELLNYDIKVDPDGDAKFGAFKTGTHDDLATALGLAVLVDQPRAASWNAVDAGLFQAFLNG